jgi:aminopeptidase N
VDAEAQRLPRGVTPTHYDLTVVPDLATATFSGEETIDVDIAAPARTIVLNAAEIRFGRASVTAGGRTQTATVTTDAAKEQASLSVAAPLPAGSARIRVSYTGILNDQLRGLYLSVANNRRYAVTQLEATDARRMFPSFDEPVYKATFSLKAVIDARDRAISNGAVIADEPGPAAGKHTVSFETTPRMSAYLLALAVGDFECREGAADGIPIRICSTPEKKNLTGFALESAEQIMRYYNRYFSVKYPFKKLDVVAVPDFAAGAMENTAAIFYRETLLLADPENATLNVRKDVAQVLAHEMAHQWFGDLVTMAWWEDIWLNEGFANWMQTKPLRAWKPEWHLELDEVLENGRAMSLDALRSTRPIRAKASTPAEIGELFDAIAYEKGAAVLRMVEAWIGEEAFRKGINAYVERFKYANARAEDFWTTIAAATGQPVDRVMASFVDQPGVPLVASRLACAEGAGTVSLSQEPYLAEPPASPPAQFWQIPVCVRAPSGKTTCDLLAGPAATLTLDACAEWVMANAGARGYYRTSYPPEVVRELAGAVETLSPAERVTVLADEWALVRAGRHGIGSFMDLVSGFARDRNAAVIETLADRLDTIGEELATGPAAVPFRTWVAGFLRPVLEEVGWTAAAGEPEDRGVLRGAVVRTLGRTARDRAVLARAREVVTQELDRPGSVEPALLDVLVPLAAIEGDAGLYDRYVARSRAANDPEERYRYLYALSAFPDPALVRKTLDYALGREVRTQDTKVLISRMLVSPDSGALAWKLLQSRWSDLQRKTGDSGNDTLIVGALQAFCDPAVAAQARTFFAAHRVPDAERTLQQSIERIALCARSAAAQRPKLADWLRGSR